MRASGFPVVFGRQSWTRPARWPRVPTVHPMASVGIRGQHQTRTPRTVRSGRAATPRPGEFRGDPWERPPPLKSVWPPAHRYNRRVAAARDEPGGDRPAAHQKELDMRREEWTRGVEPEQPDRSGARSVQGNPQRQLWRCGSRLWSCGNAASPSCAPLRRLSLEQLRYLARRQDMRRAGLGQEPAPRLPKATGRSGPTIVAEPAGG